MNFSNGDWWSRQPEIVKSAAGATVALVALSGIHTQIRHKLVLRRLHTGWCPSHCFTAAMQDSLRKKPTAYIDRPEEAAKLKLLLESPACGFFYFCTGPPGGGKTTLIQRVCHEVGEGIIYVAAGSSPGHFGTQLANALQVLEQLPNPLMLIYDYVLQFGGVEEQEKTTKLGSTLSALQAAASDFKRYKKRPAALIIDNADQLSRSEDILRHILFTAQQCADRGLLKFVFVSSDDAFIAHMLGQSRCSKAASLEILDLSEGEALELLCRRNIPSKAAVEVVNVTGGRLLQLLAAAEVLQHGGSSQDVRRIALSGAETEFQKTGLLDETPQRSAGLRAVHALLHRSHCKGGIDMETWNELVPNPQDKQLLLRDNVFAVTHEAGGGARVVFENRPVEVYAAERLSEVVCKASQEEKKMLKT
ncbi:g11418 [Coccomyxa viridis]|uniref:G11418 protein n=1 Tax=Coccomyxa viridis TaxID=1274662 RepID=A0ABP1G874_9CHLO